MLLNSTKKKTKKLNTKDITGTGTKASYVSDDRDGGKILMF